MNEIFGEENFRNCMIIKLGTSNIQSQFSTVQILEILLELKNIFYCFTKNSECLNFK